MKRSSSVSAGGEKTVRRFVFLRHEVPPNGERPSHFDLMFEQAGGLRTWAVETLPREDGQAIRGRALPLHRVCYLDYEGDVSDNRGRVTRIAAGFYESLVDSPRRVVFELQTPPYRGRLVFQSLSENPLTLPLSPAARGERQRSVPLRGRRLGFRIGSQLFADTDWEVWLELPSRRGTGNSEAR